MVASGSARAHTGRAIELPMIPRGWRISGEDPTLSRWEGDRQNEELLELSHQILELTEASHADTTPRPAEIEEQPDDESVEGDCAPASAGPNSSMTRLPPPTKC
jgi:hypothetical protein